MILRCAKLILLFSVVFIIWGGSHLIAAPTSWSKIKIAVGYENQNIADFLTSSATVLLHEIPTLVNTATRDSMGDGWTTNSEMNNWHNEVYTFDAKKRYFRMCYGTI